MCPHEEKLTAWLLGDLPPDEQDAMTRHLETCATCRALRDDLAHVLDPLRSGLSKDRSLCMANRPSSSAKPAPKHSFPRLPLRETAMRAALVAVSFGTLFALISLVYRTASRRTPPSEEQLTRIEFKKAVDESAVTPLRPLPPVAAVEQTAEHDLAYGNAAVNMPNRPVPYPQPPAAEPNMPPLKRLVKTADESPANTQASAPIPLRFTSPTAAVAISDHKKSTAGTSRAARDVRAKPILLAGDGLATTNRTATNAVPTNSVSPASSSHLP